MRSTLFVSHNARVLHLVDVRPLVALLSCISALSDVFSWRPAQELLFAVFRKVGVEGLPMILLLALLQALEVGQLLLVLQTLLEGERRNAVILAVRHKVACGVSHWVIQRL